MGDLHTLTVTVVVIGVVIVLLWAIRVAWRLISELLSIMVVVGAIVAVAGILLMADLV